MLLDSIIDEVDKSEEIEGATTELITFTKPENFGGATGVEVSYDKQFNELCVTVAHHLNIEAKKLTVAEFYNALEYLKAQAKASKKNGK